MTEPQPVDVALANAFLEAIIAERHRAHLKHGPTSMEQAPTLDPWRGLILGEEALECGKALNDERHGAIHLYADCSTTGLANPVVDELDKELIQTAAMAYTWWANRRGDRLPAPTTEEIKPGKPSVTYPDGKTYEYRDLDEALAAMQRYKSPNLYAYHSKSGRD